MAELAILSSLFEGLVNLANDSVTILPGAAERWDISGDGRVCTFHLREDARWSNGDALTAADFVESFKRLLNPAMGCPNLEYIFPIAGAKKYLERQVPDFVTEAQRMLAEAGFPAGAGFPRLELRLAAGRPDDTALAETLQQMWKEALGIEVAVAQMDKRSLIASLQAHDFQIGFSGHYYDLDDPSDMLSWAGKDHTYNFPGWHDARYEAARGEALLAATDAERMAAFARMEKILAEEVPFAPLYHLNRAHLVHPSVRGWRENRFMQVDWRELWLEAPR